jgi:hypothetical protein
VSGLIGSRADVDAFAFTGSGVTAVTVSPQSYSPDVDLRVRILDEFGSTVATINPAVARVSNSVASGLGATWSVTLPAGPATYTALVDGVGSGDPATAGNYSDYASLGRYLISLTTDYAPTALAATIVGLPTATVGVAYSATPVTVSGGTAPYVWSAIGLPAGLVIDATSGHVTGVPPMSGTFPVDVTVADAALHSVTAQAVIVVDEPSVIADDLTVASKVGQAFSAQLHATGGSGDFAWSAVGTPSGVSVSPLGVVSGTLSASGTYSFEATAVSGDLSDPAAVTLSVTAPRLSFKGDRYLAKGAVGRRYGDSIRVAGGESTFTWRVVSGSLPPGTKLTASGRAAQVSGKPTRRGSYAFAVRVRDGSGHSVYRTFSLTVRRR